MKIPGLTREESDAYATAIMAPGARTFRRATVLDLDHNPKRSLTGILGGQVRWDTDADVHTSASVVFSDLDDSIDLDLRHLVRLELGVQTPSDDVLWCPLITGWVQGCDDTGHETEVLLHDKAAFGLRNTERGRAGRGERVGEVIYRMHRDIGERHIIIPDHLREETPKIGGNGVEWGGGKPAKAVTRMARRLAKRAGLQVFYDQLGRLDLRPIPETPSVSFTETDDKGDVEVRLLAPIRWSRDFTQVCNHVIGAGKRDLREAATVRDRYRWSPDSLARGGQRTRLTHRFSDDTINSAKELEDVVEQMVRRLSRERAQVEITSTPAPWLLAEDLLHAETRAGREGDFWMGTGSLDLDGSSMAVGYQEVMRRARVKRDGRKGGRR